MPPRKAPKNASAAAAVGGRDDISNLPDKVLKHLLSFLPAQDAVRTCVLAKRWREMWKSTTGLQFVCGRMKEPSLKDIQDFVDHLLRLRIAGTRLDRCQFDLGKIDEDDMSRIILWIRIALQCKVRVLRLFCWSWISDPRICPQYDHPIFISQYLKKLELGGLDSDIMPSRFLDFGYCPVLEDLKIVDCCDRSEACLLISSQYLKHLTIVRCNFGKDCRVPICAPNLVSLWLDFSDGRTPLLQRMPFLRTAYVKINSLDDRNSAKSDDDYRNQSILLQGLSEVQSLSLIARDDQMFIYRRDLNFCSSFNNLKSLLLDEYWCEPADFSALACLLKLCPVLEKLTLELYSEEPKYKVETKLNCNPLDISAEVSRHLKIVEVKSEVYDEKMINILTFLTKQIFQGTQGSA